MGEHPNVAAARTAIKALMQGDVETLAAGIAEDAVWHVPGAHKLSGDLTGRDRILHRGQEMAEAGARFTADEIHDIVGDDEHDHADAGSNSLASSSVRRRISLLSRSWGCWTRSS